MAGLENRAALAALVKERFLGELFKAASEARANAYAPYSNHPVGVAIKAVNSDQIFKGANVETANYDVTCAEAGAITAMVVAGHTEIEDIVIAGPGEDLCSPCGRCRQRINEFSTKARDTERFIHIIDVHGTHLRSYTIEELLPDSFGPHNLDL